MTILGIETSNLYLGLALDRDGEIVFDLFEKIPMRHAEVIFSRLEEMISRASLRFDKLDRIGVSIGPGMFTGLRVGLAIAKGISYAWQIPVVPVNTLDALALPYSNLGYPVVPITDARRGMVYSAVYNGDKRISEYLLLSPDQLGDIIPPGAIVIGDGVIRCRDLVRNLTVRIPESVPIAPRATTVVILARTSKPVSITELEPFYLKKSDAEIDHHKKDET